METLKTLHAKIEKKTNSIDRVKRDLKTVFSDIVINDLKEFLTKLKKDRDSLQLEFDKMYSEFN